MDPSDFAALFPPASGKSTVLYKAVSEPTETAFDGWLDTADMHGHRTLNLVGPASSADRDKHIKMEQAAQRVAAREHQIAFGCVTIAERHLAKGTEHLNILRKQGMGAQWFISQAVYDADATIKLLLDYAAECKARGVQARKIILTFAPCGRPKVAPALEARLCSSCCCVLPAASDRLMFGRGYCCRRCSSSGGSASRCPRASRAASSPPPRRRSSSQWRSQSPSGQATALERRTQLLTSPPLLDAALIAADALALTTRLRLPCFSCEALTAILRAVGGCGVPLGISVESVSGFKEEIDGCFELFRKLQQLMLDTVVGPWGVRW